MLRPLIRRLLLGPDPATPRRRSQPETRRTRSGEAASKAAGQGNYFEALRQTSDRTPMVSAILSSRLRAGTAVLDYDRIQIAGIARALYDNGGYPAYGVNQIALYSAPMIPQAASADRDWNRAAEAFFWDWAKRADFVGRAEFDLWAIQAITSQQIDLDGDVGWTISTEAGFPQLQIVDGWRIGTGITSADRSIVDGVKIDAKGRVAGYMVEADGKPLLVPASEMILLRDPSPCSPYRGLSPFRRGSNDIRDMRDILHFEKIAVKINSGLIGVIEGQELDEDEAAAFDLGSGQPTANIPADEPQTSDTPIPDEKTAGEEGLTRADLLGGDIPVLPTGKKLSKLESNRPNAQFGEFLDTLVSQFIAGLDLPPAFFLDLKLTGPNQRAVLAKAQRKFDQRQATIARGIEWLWVRVIGWAITEGLLPAVDGWTAVKFQAPARITIDAGREAQQDREDQARSLLTRQEHFGRRGKDWEAETEQAFAEDAWIIERAKELAQASGLPLPTVLARYGFGNPNASTQAAQPGQAQEAPQQ